MAAPFDIVFHGNSKSECISFIRAVRQHAKDNGKIRDNQWIADELYNSFDDEALLWYLRLPAEIQGDWVRLQEALMNHWTTDKNEDDITTGVASLAIFPTPAAAPAPSLPSPAPSRTSSQDNRGGSVGRVRIRVRDRAEVRYLRKDCSKVGTTSGAFDTTIDVARALKVRLVASAPNFYRLELVEHESGLSVLAAFSYNSDDWNHVSCYGLLVGVDKPGQGPLKDRRTTYTGNNRWMNGRFWTEWWQLVNSGGLKLCGPADTTEAAQIFVGMGDRDQDQDGWCRFAGPNVSLHLSYVVATLEFEPLNN